MQIESNLYNRQGAAITNFEGKLPNLQSNFAQNMMKDPYCFEFLSVTSDAQGRLNFYLSVVYDKLRHKDDNPSIRILLCKSKNKVAAEYAIRDISKPIGLAEYKLGEVLPEQLKKSLP